MYVGYVISVHEAFRLFQLDESIVSSFYDIAPIQKYLKEQGTFLTFDYIDKGACILGIHINTLEKEKQPYSSVDETIIQILRTKALFLQEMKSLKVDLQKVFLTWIEEDERLVENPEPCVISI